MSSLPRSETLHSAIAAASVADAAYETAIKAKFGPKASRWDALPFDADVRAAFNAKLAADRLVGDGFAAAFDAARAERAAA